MPGEKRKLEEHNTWLGRHSKKRKKNYGQQQQPNVYYSTLSKLRNGARAFFALTSSSTSRSNEASVSLSSSASSSSSRSIPCEMCQRSVSATANVQIQHHLSCAFCEKIVCHLNQCRRCNSGFCSSCSIQNYDGEDGHSDHFICISCLAET